MTPHKPKILCVDDDPTGLALLAHALSPVDCEVFKAVSGREALEVIARESVDLVLLDILMPGMDGYEVCRAIKGVERTRNIPVVMITALISKEDRIKGIEAGAEEFLTKPFDPVEVRARVNMLLKVKHLNEKRTGDVLIELGLINDQQLQQALKISKERNIKVGEAIYAMGALSRDTIYWGLSNQLRMTYIELSPEMVDGDLIREFPLDLLKRLQCLPLYETNAEIHFAIADPTDQKSVEAIKSLKPGKGFQLHLGLPEKIADILSYYERGKRTASFPANEAIESPPISDSGKSWDDLAAALLAMPAAAVGWLYRTPRECRLLVRGESTFEAVADYPVEVYSLFQERTRPDLASRYARGETVTVFSDKSKGRPAAFKIRPIDAIDRGFVRLERLPTFSTPAFEKSYPRASRLIAETKSVFEENRRLVVGGPDRSLIKQVCYSLLLDYSRPADFPPVFFLESEADIYLPEAAQLSGLKWELGDFLRTHWEDGVPPFVFYEAGSGEAESVEACLSGFLSRRPNNVILFLPAASAKAMREALKGWKDRPRRGFRAVLIEASGLKAIC
jgi:CheY-like chemotaxis protein